MADQGGYGSNRPQQGDGVVETAVEASAGYRKRDRSVVWILVVGLALAVLAVWGYWALMSDDLAATKADNPRDEAADAALFDDTTARAPRQKTLQEAPSPDTGEPAEATTGELDRPRTAEPPQP